MKLPSIREISADAQGALLRFPLVILDAVLMTSAALLIVNHEGPAQPSVLFKVLFAGLVGIPLLTGLAQLVEKRQWKGIVGTGIQLLGVVALAFYGMSVPANPSTDPMLGHLLRLALLLASGFLFVSVAPFRGKGEINGFWQYGKSLFLRFCISVIYSGVLFVGLALALAALDNLFGVHINYRRYPELWITIAGIFSIWFFLAGIPKNLSALETDSDYPKALKIFGQNVLFPILFVYLVILYAYLGKILAAWTWPQGWVSMLIFSFAAAGIAALTLLYPLRERPEHKWLKIAFRWFFVILVPLEVTLFLAFWRRVSEYGLTEGRYLGIVLAGWLAVMSIYFILRSTKNIKIIPASLCVLALMVSFGPWGAFSLSEGRQIARLKGLLEKNSMLKDGKALKAPTTVSTHDADEMKSIFRYLHETHGYDALQPMFSMNLRRNTAIASDTFVSADEVAAELGINYQDIYLRRESNSVLNIAGYQRLLPFQMTNLRSDDDFKSGEISVHSESTRDAITFVILPGGSPADSLHVSVRPLINALLKEHRSSADNLPMDVMMIEQGNQRLKVKVYFNHISVKGLDSSFTIQSYEMQAMYTILNTP